MSAWLCQAYPRCAITSSAANPDSSLEPQPHLVWFFLFLLQVSDFNLSRFVEDHLGSRSSSAAATNPRWLPPEVLKGQRATAAGDVFAFGVVM